jgi:hypothetical protein
MQSSRRPPGEIFGLGRGTGTQRAILADCAGASAAAAEAGTLLEPVRNELVTLLEDDQKTYSSPDF